MSVRSTLPRRAVRAGAATAAAGLVVAIASAPASAHVTVTPDTTAAGSYAVLTFSVPHGCEGSPTRRIVISVPESVPQVTPTINPTWSVDKRTQKLDQPIKDAHGNEITERDAEIVYTADTPLPDGYRTTFELSLQLPEDAAGETLVFPTLQNCVKGKTAWTEVPAEGQDEEELEHPAPAIEVTEATDDEHAAATAATATEESEASDSDEAGDDDGGSNGLGVAGLAVGAVGVALGGAALARTRKG